MNLTPKQKKKMEYYLSNDPQLKQEDLDPSKNEFNSIRLQFLRVSDHFISEQDEIRVCKFCGEIYSQHTVYYFSFGSTSKKEMSDTCYLNDDISIINRPFTNHLMTKHSDEMNKILKGAKIK